MNPATHPTLDHSPGRKPSINRDDLIAAALRLLGPHRSVSTLSLREVAREADIAPNSFYRHFRDTDELAVALIELAGQSLRRIIGNARHRADDGGSIVRSSIEVFVAQLRADSTLLHILLREGTAGSDAFKAAVDKRFYRHFRDTDELAVALIELAGQSLRRIIGNARHRADDGGSIVRSSIEVFVAQLRADSTLLHILLREGTAGSDAFKAAVDKQLTYFEEELHSDLIRLNQSQGSQLHDSRLAARAVTRLVFAIGATAIDLPAEKDAELIDQLSTMVRMILAGARALHSD